MGKTMMDGKSKNERPTQSESFESFHGIKMINSNPDSTGSNNSSSPRLPHTFPRPPYDSPQHESIDEEHEVENSSLENDPQFRQTNQRVVPTAPPRSQLPMSPEMAHLKGKPHRSRPYPSPRRNRSVRTQKCGKQDPTPPPPRKPEPDSPPPASPNKMRNFKTDVEGFIGGLEVSHDVNEKMDWFTNLLTVLSMIIVVVTFPFSMIFCLKIVAEYERAVVLRMGRLLPGGKGTKGPGLFFVLPCIDRVRKVELRTVTFSIPPQEVLTRDSVTVAVDAVVYYRICNPAVSILNVEDAARSTRLLAQTTLRNVLGTKDLAQILMDREEMSVTMKASIDAATEAWGVKVERVEIKDVRLPVALQRAMAAEAEATREARAKVIAANGEHKASSALKEAANVIASSPLALQLRYLQTLCAISAEKNSTIIFPLPIDILNNGARLGSSATSLNEGSHQCKKGLVQKWLPSVSPDKAVTTAVTPNPRTLLPGMGEPDPLIPQPTPPDLPESQRRRYEAAALLTATGTKKLSSASTVPPSNPLAAAAAAAVAKSRENAPPTPPPPPRAQQRSGVVEDLDDTCSDSV